MPGRVTFADSNLGRHSRSWVDHRTARPARSALRRRPADIQYNPALNPQQYPDTVYLPGSDATIQNLPRTPLSSVRDFANTPYHRSSRRLDHDEDDELSAIATLNAARNAGSTPFPRHRRLARSSAVSTNVNHAASHTPFRRDQPLSKASPAFLGAGILPSLDETRPLKRPRHERQHAMVPPPFVGQPSPWPPVQPDESQDLHPNLRDSALRWNILHQTSYANCGRTPFGESIKPQYAGMASLSGVRKITLQADHPSIAQWMHRWGPLIVEARDHREVLVVDVLDAIYAYFHSPMALGDFKYISNLDELFTAHVQRVSKAKNLYSSLSYRGPLRVDILGRCTRFGGLRVTSIQGPNAEMTLLLGQRS